MLVILLGAKRGSSIKEQSIGVGFARGKRRAIWEGMNAHTNQEEMMTKAQLIELLKNVSNDTRLAIDLGGSDYRLVDSAFYDFQCDAVVFSVSNEE